MLVLVLVAAGCGSAIKADGNKDSATDTGADTSPDTTTDTPACTDGESCDDGDPCTFPDTCEAGVCVPGPDVCGCELDDDCDDSNACTHDVCTDGSCAHEDVACVDDNPCTTDGCNPEAGCTFAPNEEPCDDGDPCTAPDMCHGGGCVPGEELPTWFRDGDHDGFGVGHETVCGAEPPPGYAAEDGDCCDSHPDVHPDQPGYFAHPYHCDYSSPPSHDYDCDGFEDERWTDLGECWIDDWGRCRTTRGWETYYYTPSCGEISFWIDSCAWDPYSGWCYPDAAFERAQECR
jgi:hypothetical protein